MSESQIRSGEPVVPKGEGSSRVDKAQDSNNKKWGLKRIRASWRLTILAGLCVALIICAINIVVLIWCKALFADGNGDGIVTIFTGSCASVKRTTFWLDLVINILSTTLLAASNHCAQVLCSPSRLDIDRAHAQGSWMDIGVHSLRNLTHVARWRVAVWALLALSSVPLHLLYNSVIFASLAGNDYQVVLVTQNFLAGGWWNETNVNAGFQYSYDYGSGLAEAGQPITAWQSPYLNQIRYMQKHQHRLQRFESQECAQVYGQSLFGSPYRSVLIVSNITTLSNNVIEVWLHSPLDVMWSPEWVCGYTDFPTINGLSGGCDERRLANNASFWAIPAARQCSEYWYDNTTYVFSCRKYTAIPAEIEYCLAQHSPTPCTMRINTHILLAVIGCNLVKIGCLIYTMFAIDFRPLVTIGDAIASFLDSSERLTEDAGPLSMRHVKVWKRNADRRIEGESQLNLRFSRTWARSMGIWQWCLCVAPGLICIVAGAGLLSTAEKYYFSHRYSPAKVMSQGINKLNLKTVLRTLNLSLSNTIILSNTPQFVVSFAYLLYNHAFTTMVLAYEWGRFSQVRKPLRVSRPISESDQRSTYWLQLPYHFILPLMASMAVLHWLVGRSLFFVQLKTYNIRGHAVDYAQLNSCAWGSSAIAYSLILGSFLVSALFACSVLPLAAGMPIAGSCSLAISAACHTMKEDDDAMLKPIMYGIIGGDPSEETGRVKVGFSSGEVLPLEKGKDYSVQWPPQTKRRT